MSHPGGIMTGTKVLDLSWGISGPMTGMLLADNGADVIKVEPPGGDPFRSLSGYRVWNRGKRSAIIDLKDETQNEKFLALAAQADVLIESFSPGTTEKLGIDYATVGGLNPLLVYCSITGYGTEGPQANRPGYDSLVAARTGQQWESRGVVGGTIGRLSGGQEILPGLEAPEGCWVGAPRQGPVFGGVPWASMATFYNATIGITAALRARGITGKGQRVATSLLQGVLTCTYAYWLKVEKPDTQDFQTWVIDPRAPKGFFECSDGRWTHHWHPLPDFILGVSEGDTIQVSDEIAGPRESGSRISTAPEEMLVLHALNDTWRDRVRKFTADEWTEAAAKVGTPVQKVRSPEEALADPLLVADGCVTEVVDPEFGRLRQVGSVLRLNSHFTKPQGPAPAAGQHTTEVLAEADACAKAPTLLTGVAKDKLSHPLDGIRVLDLGLAVAGPYGTQVLAELGAEVIKVNTVYDSYWFSNHFAMGCNKHKSSIAVNLKDAQGLELLHKLVSTADVVQHNMRYDATERLGVDYDSLRQIKPDLIYCHTRGHEKGPREFHPGNDQTAAALSGVEWLDGGCDRGGKPFWPLISLGDTGNGMLSALGIIQALIHRDNTGEGQFLDTSILYAHLLNTSMTWISADGKTVAERPKVDSMQQGWNALYRLYETSDARWVCIAAVTDAHFHALAKGLGSEKLAADSRFATACARSNNDQVLIAELEPLFKAHTAQQVFMALDKSGVPVEISDPDFVIDFFNDPVMKTREWVGTYTHPVVGTIETGGLVWDFSDTPGKLWKGPLWPGQNTREIMKEIGYDDEDVQKLIEQGVVDDKSDMRST